MAKKDKKSMVESGDEEQEEDKEASPSEDHGSTEPGSESGSELDPTQLTKKPSSSSRAALKKTQTEAGEESGSESKPTASELVPPEAAGKRPLEEREAHSKGTKNSKKKSKPETSRKINKYEKMRKVSKDRMSSMARHEQKINQLSEKIVGDVERSHSGVDTKEWEQLRIEEIELYSRQMELRSEQMKLVWEVLKSVDM